MALGKFSEGSAEKYLLDETVGTYKTSHLAMIYRDRLFQFDARQLLAISLLSDEQIEVFGEFRNLLLELSADQITAVMCLSPDEIRKLGVNLKNLSSVNIIRFSLGMNFVRSKTRNGRLLTEGQMVAIGADNLLRMGADRIAVVSELTEGQIRIIGGDNLLKMSVVKIAMIGGLTEKQIGAVWGDNLVKMSVEQIDAVGKLTVAQIDSVGCDNLVTMSPVQICILAES